MTDEIEVAGAILSSMPIGEYDKRVVILTERYGKIHAFARGARRINSKLLAGTEPFTFGKFKLFSGKNAYTLSDVRIVDFFERLKTDIDRLYYGFYFLEVISYFSKENAEAKELPGLLYSALKALEEGDLRKPPSFVRSVFEWKMIALEGIMPDYGSGRVCGERISDTVRYTLDFIMRTKPSKIFGFTLTEEEMRRLTALSDLYLKYNIDHTFKSLEMITEVK